MPLTLALRMVANALVLAIQTPAVSQVVQWHIDPQPTLVIGARDHSDGFLFGNIRHIDVHSNGSFYVADSRRQQIAVFSPTGKFIRTIGSRGEAPGEFSSVSFVMAHDDRVVVLDSRLRRLTVFDTVGTYVRTEPLRFDDSYSPLPIALLRNSVLMIEGTGARGPSTQQGIIRDTLNFTLRDRESGGVAKLAAIEDNTRLRLEYQGSVRFPYTPLGASPVYHSNGSAAVLGGGSTEEYAVVDSRGAIEWRRHRLASRPVSKEIRQAFVESTVAGLQGAELGRWSKYLDTVDFPDALPYYDQLLVDSLDHVWIRSFGLDGDVGVWRVFNPVGVPVATVEMDGRFVPQKIGEHVAHGIYTTAEGVDYVHSYRLERY